VPRIIDLTHPLASGVGHPMFRKFQVAPFHVHEIHRRSNADICMAIHTATHIDAPYHFFPEGETIDAIALDRLVGPAALFPVQSIARPRHRLTVSDLEGVRKGPLRDMIAVVATGWSNVAFQDAARYFGEGPTLSPEAATWLADGGVKAVVLDCGTDAPEPVPVPDQTLPVHHILLGRGIPIVENCTDLVRIPDGRVTIHAVPLKIAAESGAPARVYAVVEP
jgi:kynurenine formamidase